MADQAVVARVCLNMLRARNVRREEALGVRVPDPLVSTDAELQPEQEALLANRSAWPCWWCSTP